MKDGKFVKKVKSNEPMISYEISLAKNWEDAMKQEYKDYSENENIKNQVDCTAKLLGAKVVVIESEVIINELDGTEIELKNECEDNFPSFEQFKKVMDLMLND